MVNNPVMVVGGPFENHSKEDIDHTVLGSLTMMMYGAHAALEFLLPQGSGKIINIGSVGDASNNAGWSSTTRVSPASSGSPATWPTKSLPVVSTSSASRRES